MDGGSRSEMGQVLTRRRFSVEDYHRMGKAGVLREDDRVELIRGEVVRLAAIGRRHALVVNRLNAAFARLGNRVVLSPQDPVGDR